MVLPVAVEGQRQHCKQVSFDVRELATSMGPEYEREIEQNVMIAGSPQQPAKMRMDTKPMVVIQSVEWFACYSKAATLQFRCKMQPNVFHGVLLRRLRARTCTTNAALVQSGVLQLMVRE